MINTGKLVGRTAFITGASRGIGKAIALKLARDGANIVIAAKTTQAHPKLPGTIYTAAKEVEAAGGKCLPCVVDIRNEDQIQAAVDAAVEKFGGIDILVNNASAISLTGTVDTNMKRYDLMHQINTRGTFLVSKICIPHLQKGKNPHILNISPPLNLNPLWFKNHVAYTMAKYGMSMCVLGMAEELQEDGIAVNALWPRTAIATAAMDMLAGDEASKQCRKPEIMADAAYAVLLKDSKSLTGKFLLDDEVLHESGITDLDQYACEPGNQLMPDFFLDELPGVVGLKKTSGLSGTTQKASYSTLSGHYHHIDQLPVWRLLHTTRIQFEAVDDSIPDLFKKMETAVSKEAEEVKKIGAVYQFKFTGADKGDYFIDLKSAKVGTGESETKPDVVLTMDGKIFQKLFAGSIKPTTAYMTGKLKLKGDMKTALKLEGLLNQLKSKL